MTGNKWNYYAHSDASNKYDIKHSSGIDCLKTEVCLMIKHNDFYCYRYICLEYKLIGGVWGYCESNKRESNG